MELTETITQRIKIKLGFTINIGISNNKLLAKVASDFKEPDRIYTLFPHEIKENIYYKRRENKIYGIYLFSK